MENEQSVFVSILADEKVNTNQIKQDFDRIAALPEPTWNHNSHFHPFLLTALPPRIERLLDLGCGTGSFTRLASPRCQEVLGIDLSPRMIENARDQSREYPNIHWEMADFLERPWQDRSFDAIVSIATIHHLPAESFARLAQRILRPGGTLVVLDLRRDESIVDLAITLASMMMSQLHRAKHRQGIRPSAEARAAWEEHAQHDHYPSYREARSAFARLLPGSVVRRHLYWRYSLVWTAP